MEQGRADAVRQVLKAAVDEPGVLEALRKDPTSLAERFGLDDAHLAALRGADVFVALRPRAITYTFITGSTITARPVRRD